MTMLDDVLYPTEREPQRQVNAHEQGVVLSVSDAGVRFTLDNFPSTAGFGPAPYARWATETALSGDEAHTHVMVGPQAGDRCLVAFAGPGVSRPWVVAWSAS